MDYLHSHETLASKNINQYDTNHQNQKRRESAKMTSFAKRMASSCLLAVSLIGLPQSTLAGNKSILKPLTLQEQQAFSEERMLRNFAPLGTVPGIIVASPSKVKPNYFHHWVRDAALAFETALQVYQQTDDRKLRQQVRGFVLDYLSFNQKIQNDSRAITGLGEPRFYVDGTPSPVAWGRPQNDSPALRAINYVTLLKLIEREQWPEQTKLTSLIYSCGSSANSLLKMDLEYVASHWQEASFDLWEEVKGAHFFTLLVQRKALLLGAEVATRSEDLASAFYYRTEAAKIATKLNSFWDGKKGYIRASQGLGSANNGKTSSLDTAVLLGAIAGETTDDFFAAYDDRILATLNKLERTFAPIYSINNNSSFGIALGRYPEDRYDGYTTNAKGNPWFISTQAGAEVYYRTFVHLTKVGKIEINQINRDFYQALLTGESVQPGSIYTTGDALYSKLTSQLLVQGDKMLARTIHHRAADGSLSEQMNRDCGTMQGADDLTWSHSSFLTALHWRAQALANSVGAN